MRRVLVGVFSVLLLVTTGMGAQDARAEDQNWSISRFDITAEVAETGRTEVTLDFDFDFVDEGRGPYITVPTRQRILGDPDNWMLQDVELLSVESPSGANTEVSTEEESGVLTIRIGNEDTYFTGRQTYIVRYAVTGLVAPASFTGTGQEEFNWNAVGPGWKVPLSNISVTVKGPVDVVAGACWTGADYDQPCAVTAAGTTVSAQIDSLEQGIPLQIVAGFPEGTFPDAAIRKEKRYHIGNMFPVTPLTGGLTAALTALGLGWLLVRTRRGARDQVFLGLTPGLTPTSDDESAQIGTGGHRAPIAVAFTPPPGARPGEIGVLVDSVANDSDITATLIDLAVRGHLRIEQLGGDEWRFVKLETPDKLADYEAGLLDQVFSAGPTITTEDFKSGDGDFSSVIEQTRTQLYQRVTTELNWFTRNPRQVRLAAIGAGVLLILAGLAIGLLAGLAGFGLLGLAGVVTGTVVLVMSSRFGARTATGSAVLAQAKGFELYLRTAEADQLRFEEGVDIYSRYLPYAIVFGVAERWTKLFADLAAQGRYQPNDSWCVGYLYGSMMSPDFTHSVSNLASSMTSAIQQGTAATSGGSGFSGGGGFGGGGGGGW